MSIRQLTINKIMSTAVKEMTLQERLENMIATIIADEASEAIRDFDDHVDGWGDVNNNVLYYGEGMQVTTLDGTTYDVDYEGSIYVVWGYDRGDAWTPGCGFYARRASDLIIDSLSVYDEGGDEVELPFTLDLEAIAKLAEREVRV